MKNDLNFFGMKRPGGSSEAEGKRRAVLPGSAEWLNMDRPRSLVKVLGFISPPSLAQFKAVLPSVIILSSDSATELLT